ncbi:unnamed protein product [Polarella glacialis]|uniref:Sugar phosphate transporter domain-containing protein n=1 Tax=Polarella glacialis TaxID=89957 RepID=A0A813IGZ2_POLGL|nr:unnamed protein product [Polarella glacialis]
MHAARPQVAHTLKYLHNSAIFKSSAYCNRSCCSGGAEVGCHLSLHLFPDLRPGTSSAVRDPRLEALEQGLRFASSRVLHSLELSFTPFGFATAMASNFCFVTRNVLATKFGSTGDMGEDKVTRKTNQLSVLTIVATAVLFPLALLLPGGLMSVPAAWSASIAKGVPASKLVTMLATSGFYFFMYQLSSFWVLSCVPPITHSVLNTLKRVVIIVVSIVVFRTPVTKMGLIGTLTAIGGVLLYTLTKAHYSKKEKEQSK